MPVNFSYDDLTNADFSNAKLTRADFTNTILDVAMVDDCIGKVVYYNTMESIRNRGANNMNNKFMTNKTPQQLKEEMMNFYSKMTPEKFFEHIISAQKMAEIHGKNMEQEEIVCRLLASGMSVDEISLILCVRKENIKLIERNNAKTKIPDYAKKLKTRFRSRQKATSNVE
jgi:DNA-binding NarL/FixJ family response regulator